MALEIRTITDDEAGPFRESLLQTFGIDPADDPGSEVRFRALIDREQAWAAFDGATIAGTAATFQLTIGVPGGSLPIAGLTMVSVRPTHRRRGLASQLVRRHLDDAKQRGYAASGLWASEASIYGRFGYGVAAEHDELRVRDTHTLAMHAGDLDELEWITEARAREVYPEIYARATAERPGALRRTAAWWRERMFLETPFARHGASLRRHVIARRGDTPVGYVAYRQKQGDGQVPGGSAHISELHAIDARAEATLWRFALSLDLFHDVSWWCAPVDCALPFMLDDHRRAQRTRADNLWLRIEDVPAALRARRYAADDVLRFTIEDTTYELVVEGGEARCAPTTREPELVMPRTALGTLYLGGFAASRLARANVVRGDAAALAKADRLFGWPIAPWCPEVF